MPEYNFTLRGFIRAPEGTKLSERGHSLILPDGRRLKVWECFEIEDNDENSDVTIEQLAAMDIATDGDMAEFEETA